MELDEDGDRGERARRWVNEHWSEKVYTSWLRHKLTISGRTGSCLDTPLLNWLRTPLSWISRPMLHARSLVVKSTKLLDPPDNDFGCY